MFKLAAAACSMLVSLGLAAFNPPSPPLEDGPPPHKEKGEHKKKGEPKKKGGPEAKGEEDLRRAYYLLRRLRVDDNSASRPEERIRDWTERASKYYRDGLKALDGGDERLAHEYGAIAHDLAQAADHAHNAALCDRHDPSLPSPPEGKGPDEAERARHDLRRAYDRISDFDHEKAGPDAEPFLRASRDLYSAARRDIEAGRDERGGELARAAEAMTHVIDHITHVADRPDRPEPKERRDRPEPKEKRSERRDSDLPPPLEGK
jgi:hypothetical protein